MPILVVGGAGYIGSVTVEYLINAGFQVTVLDNLSRGYRGAVHPEARFVEADFGSADDLQAIFDDAKYDAVLHFGAHSLVGESVENPALYFNNNVSNGITMLDTMIKNGIKKIVFSSTAATYGQPEQIPITEDCFTAPTNPYGDSKLAFEKILKAYSHAYGLSSTSLRYFNAAGASRAYGEAHSPETHLIAVLLQVASGEKEDITIFGDDYPTKDGTCIRDYIHVLDLADAHLKALEDLNEGGQCKTFNLGNGSGFSVNEVVEVARAITGADIPAHFGKRRPGDPASLIASSQRIKEELGWQPEHSNLHTIVKDAWAWKQAHPQGYCQKNGI